MLCGMAEPTASARVTVRAQPDLVYDLVTDVEHMPDWMVECQRHTWRGRDAGPRVGARFRGHNRRGWRRWSTTATVTDADRGRRFAFRVTSFGLPVSAWSYDIERSPDGCAVTESMEYRAGWLLRYVLAPVATGMTNRAARIAENERNIARTLAQLKAAAEARATAARAPGRPDGPAGPSAAPGPSPAAGPSAAAQ
jgi:uncharacterized protein YndB with AHSA1/START domain